MKKSAKTGFTRVFDLLDYQQNKFPQKRALNSYKNGKWEGFSIAQIQLEADKLSCWFLDKGYKKGDKIVIVPRMGRPEWMIFDFACQQVGIILVPIHDNASDLEIEHIILETNARYCLTADSGLYFKLKLVISNLELDLDVKHIEAHTAGFFEGFKLGKVSKTQLDELQRHKDNIKEDDILSIMYTSGSTGTPKGVILTHKNIVSNILSILVVFPLKQTQKVLSFLPFSHILERTAAYAYIAYGVNVYFSTSRESIIHDFKMVKPYFCTMVPRILEKMYEYLQTQLLEKSWLKRKLVQEAFNVAKKYGDSRSKSVLYLIKLFVVRILVLNRTKKQLGGKLKCMAVGAAALRPDIARMFSAGGIKIREGYGLTETSPLVTLNRFDPGMNRFGTVGIPIPGVQVSIDALNAGEEGEILVKGPNVTTGYFRQAELTKQAFTEDGWLRTGDIGKFVEKKFLKITDRKKDIFKTSAGRYIAPLPLENHFSASPFIQQCQIIGFNRSFVTALLVPHLALLEKWCNNQGIHWTSPQYMILNIKVREKIMQEIERLNEELPNYKRVRDFVLCDQEWTIETGEMTANYKLLRSQLVENNRKEIDKMYEGK